MPAVYSTFLTHSRRENPMKKLIRPAVILLILLALLGVALTIVRVIGTRSLQRLID